MNGELTYFLRTVPLFPQHFVNFGLPSRCSVIYIYIHSKLLNYQTVQYHCHPYIHPSTIMFTHFPKYTPDIIAVFPDTKRLVPILSFPHESTVPGRVGVGFSPMVRQWSKYVFLQLGTLKKVLAVLDSARETDGFFSLTLRRRFLKHGPLGTLENCLAGGARVLRNCAGPMHKNRRRAPKPKNTAVCGQVQVQSGRSDIPVQVLPRVQFRCWLSPVPDQRLPEAHKWWHSNSGERSNLV